MRAGKVLWVLALAVVSVPVLGCSGPEDTEIVINGRPEGGPGVVASWKGDGGAKSELSHPLMSVWKFESEADRMAPSVGSGTLSVVGGAQPVQFGTASSFGLPALPGGDASVAYLPAFGPDQGLKVADNSPSNGFFTDLGLLSRYTIIWDVLWPAEVDGQWRALYQADIEDSDDAELYVENKPSGGVGVGNSFQGSITPGQWHRIAVVVRAADGEGNLQKFVDGTFVGGQGTTGGAIDGQWALPPSFWLFADNDGQTAPVYVAGIAVVGEALNFDDVRALGGPTAAGPQVAGAAGAPWAWKASRDVMVFGHRGDPCCAPENTVVSIEQAFQKGADHVEIDIRLTKDGTAVVMHDKMVDRTTDGSGEVASLTLAELKQLDAGVWFAPQFAGTRVPTLAEALKTLKGRGRAYLDIKDDDLAPAIAAAIQEAQVPLNAVWCWLSSRHELEEYAEELPGVPLLYASTTGWEDAGFFDELKSKGVEGFSIRYADFSQAFGTAARSKGLFVEVFTILDPEMMRSAIEAGVDGMETDYPEVLRSLLPRGAPGSATGSASK